ncbi:MAG TPA: hypothetical protein VHD69_01630 [Candidatus Paceibacterota bacterium]|nr:hypothetical protein [Candidatus Paceibacterota bacterium]
MTDRRKVKRLMTMWIAIGAVLIIAGYGAFQAKNLAEGPVLSVDYPANGATVSNTLVEIGGTAKNIAFLTLNGDKIFTDEAGAYREKILVSPGYNMITLEARDRFGRIARKTLQLNL